MLNSFTNRNLRLRHFKAQKDIRWKLRVRTLEPETEKGHKNVSRMSERWIEYSPKRETYIKLPAHVADWKRINAKTHTKKNAKINNY